MADGLDVVLVRIQNECPIVIGMVVGAKSWSAIVAATGGNRSRKERIDVRAARCKRVPGTADCQSRDSKSTLDGSITHVLTANAELSRARGAAWTATLLQAYHTR